LGGTLHASVLVFIAVPALILCVWFGRRRVPHLQLLVRCIFIVYLTGLVGVTLFPLPVVPSEIRLQRQMVHNDPTYPRILGNAVPGKGVLHDVQTAERGHRFGLSFYRGLMPIWGNVLLLLPLGFFLPWLSARWRRWKAIALVLLLTAVGFELIQLAGTLAYGFPYMRIDVDTIWLSFIGGMIGFGLFKVMTPHLQLLGMKNEDAVE